MAFTSLVTTDASAIITSPEIFLSNRFWLTSCSNRVSVKVENFDFFQRQVFLSEINNYLFTQVILPTCDALRRKIMG